MKAATKLIITGAGGLIICLVLVFVLIKPTLTKVNDLNTQLKSRKTEVKTLDQQITAFKSAQSDLSRATQRDRILGAVVEGEDLVSAIEVIEDAARITATKHTLTIPEQVVGPKSKPQPPVLKGVPGVKEVPYQLSANTDFQNLIYFLQYLEHSPHFTEITGIRLVAEIASSGSSFEKTAVTTGNVITNIDGIFFIKNGSAPTKESNTNTNESKTSSETE